jgi:GxxExxY protein
MAQSLPENFDPLTEREQWLAEQVVDIAFTIHKALGPELLENVYEKCFCYELDSRNISYTKQQCVEIIYNDHVTADGLRIDIMVEDLINLELKAQEESHSIWQAQLLSYLKLSNKRLGYILNFHVPLMKNGIKRMIL